MNANQQEQENERKYIEKFKKMSDQERIDLVKNLRILGCPEYKIQWFTIHYSQFLTLSRDI